MSRPAERSERLGGRGLCGGRAVDDPAPRHRAGFPIIPIDKPSRGFYSDEPWLISLKGWENTSYTRKIVLNECCPPGPAQVLMQGCGYGR
jgi:hypothetical protein